VARKSTPEAPLTVIGANTFQEGDLSWEGRVRIDGHYKGRLYSEEQLEVGVDGFVEGDADVARATVAGRMSGRIRVREKLILLRTARIEGKLDVGLLEIAPGARVQADVSIRGSEIP
jgi:cytoskeletal protein CcmA (bactofilin family)